MTRHVLVGREPELPEIVRFLEARRSAAALVLCGEAGIGKTALWEAGIAHARARGLTVLSARGSEAEAQLPFAALTDLLESVDPLVLDEVPGPQRYALEVALCRVEATRPAEPFAISAGVLNALRRLAARSEVLVALDDAPWLDPASAAPVTFAARRLAAGTVRFLISRRSGPPTDLEWALEPAGVERLEVGPLSFGAVSLLLGERLERVLPRRVLRQVFEVSRGNPLLALELGRALIERGLPEIGAGLPVPELVSDVFSARVAALPAAVRRVLLVVSLSGGLSRDELAAVADPLALEDAQASGVLIVEGVRVRASHPLLAGVALQHSSAGERRELHLALAEAVTDRVLAARHRAMAAVRADARLAGELAAAARFAAEQGAVYDAVALGEHALRLTPPSDRGGDAHVLDLAGYLTLAGEPRRVAELLTPRIGNFPRGPLRAEARLLLGEAAVLWVEEEEHIARAIADSAEDPSVRARALARLSILCVLNRVARIAEADETAGEALAAARAALAARAPGGPDAERAALAALAWARIMSGRAVDDLTERSEHAALIGPNVIERPAGVRMAFRGEVAPARETFQRLLVSADERGEARAAWYAQIQLCELALRTGEVREAAPLAAEVCRSAALEPELAPIGLRLHAQLAAVEGTPVHARECAGRLLENGQFEDILWDRLEARRALGLAALFDREPERAAAELEAVWEHTVREGIDDPGAFPVAGDLVEALAELRELPKAAQVVERLARLAAEQQHPWGRATAARSAAILKLAAGYDEAGSAELAMAATGYRAQGLHFDAARTLLVLGRVQRRANKRAAARRSLQDAEAIFEQLGSSGWAEQARSELSRVSGRRPAQVGTLTATERRVAELAARGLSNKEIASQLVVSVYTVQTHLRRVYGKLGIRSRTRLAAALVKDH